MDSSFSMDKARIHCCQPRHFFIKMWYDLLSFANKPEYTLGTGFGQYPGTRQPA